MAGLQQLLDQVAADLAVLERYADPNALTRLGMTRLTALITKASHHHQGAERASQWLEAAQASLALYDGHPAYPDPGVLWALAAGVCWTLGIGAFYSALAAGTYPFVCSVHSNMTGTLTVQ
jgi:hypothetical protein